MKKLVLCSLLLLTACDGQPMTDQERTMLFMWGQQMSAQSQPVYIPPPEQPVYVPVYQNQPMQPANFSKSAPAWVNR